MTPADFTRNFGWIFGAAVSLAMIAGAFRAAIDAGWPFFLGGEEPTPMPRKAIPLPKAEMLCRDLNVDYGIRARSRDIELGLQRLTDSAPLRFAAYRGETITVIELREHGGKTLPFDTVTGEAVPQQKRTAK